MPASTSVVPRLSSRPGLFDFFQGFALPFQALRWIFRTRKLFTLSALSGAVTAVSLAAVVWLVATYTDDLLGWVWAKPEGGLAAAAWWLVAVLAFLVLLVTGANIVPLLLQTPLQDPISEATEELCGDFTAPAFSAGGLLRGVSVSLVHTLKRILILLAGHALLFALNVIPGVGSLVWSVAASIWTMLWSSAEYVGGPMARHLYPFSEVRRVLQARPALSLGFGAAVYLILWIPIVNLFFIPLALVGGTLAFRGLRAAGVIGPSPAAARSSAA